MLALQACLRDIRAAREAPDMAELPAAEVILISDGRSTVLPYVQEDVRQSGIQLHVVSLGTFRNSDLEAIAASFSAIPDAANLQGIGQAPPPADRPTPGVSHRPAPLPGG
jgi:hypothetical protein